MAEQRPSRRRVGFCFLPFLLLALIQGLSLAAAGERSLVRFAVIGDSGTGDQRQYRIAQQMLAWHERLPFSLTVMLGDNIYGGFLRMGGGNKKDFEAKFDRPYAALLARGVTFRAALGNHDVRQRDGRDLIESYSRFHIDGQHGYYSFTAGQLASGIPLIEFFVLNTTRLEKGRDDSEQLAWLERSLKSSRSRWRIVIGHHPLYSTGRRHGSDLALRKKLVPLMSSSPASPQEPAQTTVHVVLAGHDHIFQRFHPQKGVVYFVCGSSGSLRRGNATASPLVAAVEDRQGVFMLWEATSQELRFRAINEQGAAFDCGAVARTGSVASVDCSAFSHDPR